MVGHQEVLPCTSAVPGIFPHTCGYHFSLTERENLLTSVSCCLHVQCFTQKWGEGAPLNQTLSQLGEGLDPGDLWLRNGAAERSRDISNDSTTPFPARSNEGTSTKFIPRVLGTISSEVSIHCAAAANIEINIFISSWSIVIVISQAENQFVSLNAF